MPRTPSSTPTAPSATRPVNGRRAAGRSPSGLTATEPLAVAVRLAVAVGLAVVLAAAVAPAAAADPGVDNVTVSPASADAGASETHQITVSISDVGDNATVTATLPEAFAGGSDGEVSGVSDAGADGGSVESVGYEDGNATATVDAADGVDRIDVTLTVDLRHPTVARSHEVSVAVEDGSGTATGSGSFETTESAIYRVGGADRDTVFGGQTVTVTGLTPDRRYELRRDDGNGGEAVLAETADDAGSFAFETPRDEMPTGAVYYLDVEAPEDGFELLAHDPEASFGDESVDDAGDGSTTTFSVDSTLRTDTHPVEVSAGGALDAEELYRVFTGGESADGAVRLSDPSEADDADLDPAPSGFAVAMYGSGVDGHDSTVVLLNGGESSGTVDFEGATTTTYDFEVEAIDTGATASASVSVSEAQLDGSFGQTTYSSPAGDLVDISVNLGAADEGYVLIGGGRLSDSGAPAGYFDVLHVAGDATVTVNTRLVGSDAPTDAVYDSDTAVTSYAHEYGASTPARETEAFSDLRFEDASGREIADSLAGFRGEAGTGTLPGPLVPQRYRLTVGAGDAIVLRDDGVVEPSRAFARSHLVLTRPAFREEIDMFTAPGGSAVEAEAIGALREVGLERAAVTKGDRLVLGFEATGMWGALTHLSDRETAYGGESEAAVLEKLLAEEEGVSLTVRQTNPGRNERRSELDLGDASTGDAYVTYREPEDLDELGDGPTAGGLFLVVDTRDGTGFTEDVEPGDEFAVEFAFEGVEGDRYRYADSGPGAPGPFAAESAADDDVAEQFPYWTREEGGVSVTRTFTIQAETWEYDDVTEADELLVRPEAEASITGNTTMLPAAEMTAEFISDAGPEPRVSADEVEIDEGGNFSVAADFSGLDPGSRVTLELYEGGELYDSRSVVVVEDPDDPFSLGVERAPNLTVTRGETLANLSVAVRNDGAIEGRAPLSIAVDDGGLTASRTVSVDPGERENVTFSRATVDLEPGEYVYTAAIDGDTASGTLTVDPGPDAVAGGTSEPDGNETDEATDEGSETTGDGDGGEGDDGESDGGEGDDGESESADAEGSDDGDDEAPDDDPATLLPFGIGTRETFGGTVLVGATYLLGHWV